MCLGVGVEAGPWISHRLGFRMDHYVCDGAEDTLGKYSFGLSNFGTSLCLDGTEGSSGMSSSDSFECGSGLVVWMSRQRAGPG